MPCDNKTIIPSITDMLSNDVKYKKIKLVGDKGYASKLEDKVKLLNDYKVELIYPHRKNQKTKTSKQHKKSLKYRYKVAWEYMKSFAFHIFLA